MSKWRVLIVDDDREMRQSLVDLMEAAGWYAEALSRATDVERRLSDLQPDVILSDVRMPGMTGLELLARLAGDGAPPMVLISAHGDIPMAVQAMQRGAYSFVEKPYEPRRLLTILSHAAEQHQMRASNRRLRARLSQLSGLDRVLLGGTEAMARLRRDVFDLADSPAAVLIAGETGTGKELVARALHDIGPQSTGPFVALNCATLTPERFSAGLTGDGGGALFSATGGTVFLDEICACPLDVQAMLLRLIEDKAYQPPDAAAPLPLAARFLAATNEDAAKAVADGRLRQDLLYRLNTITLTLPPLRDRRDDLVLLLLHFLEETARLYEIVTPELTQDDLAALLAHDWPGNVRELRSVAERRVLMARRGTGGVAEAIAPKEAPDEVPHTLREAVAAFEREMIGKAINAHQGRMDAVAEALGIGRRTLNEKIVKLGLDKDAFL